MHNYLNNLNIIQNKKRSAEILNTSSYKFKYGNIQLSIRETQVIAGIIFNLTAKQMAKQLHLSPRTIEYYLSNIKNKFNGRCRHEIICYVIEHGFPIYKFLQLFANF